MTERTVDDRINLLNEISLLNNEMANSQRNLVKQNAEVTKLNKQLNEINTTLEQFTYVASHDLKEPLRMITAFMELLKKKYGNVLDAKANSYIDFALDGGRRMETLITDLLTFSGTGHDNQVKQQTDISSVLKEVKQNLEMVIQDTHCEISTLNTLPVLYSYNTDISRLFQNLLSNAIKFRKKDVPPQIKISAIEFALEWMFIIQDNGIGIKKENLIKVFDIFMRVHSRKEFEGTGLGLAICKKIVEQHGGRIWIESEQEKGSTIHFTLLKS